MLARLLVGFLVVASFAPLGAAQVPAPVADPNAEIVSSHSLYNYITQHVCSSGDPVLGIVSTDLTSRLAHTSSGADTTFTLHLDAIPADDLCPALDLVFTVPIAYPAASPTWAAFTATCGATGSFVIYPFTTGTSFQLYLSAPNGECGLPAGSHAGGFSISQVVAGPALACGPLVVAACFGVYDHVPQQHYNDCDGQASSTTVSVGFDLVYGSRRCQFWSDGREHAVVQDSFGFVTIDTTEDSCTIQDGLVGIDQPCPEEVRSAIFGVNWGHVLP